MSAQQQTFVIVEGGQEISNVGSLLGAAILPGVQNPSARRAFTAGLLLVVLLGRMRGRR